MIILMKYSMDHSFFYQNTRSQKVIFIILCLLMHEILKNEMFVFTGFVETRKNKMIPLSIE